MLKKGDRVFYVEKIGEDLFDRPAEVLGEATPRCAVCREPETGHGRRGRRHDFTPGDPGLRLRVIFPADRRPKLPEETVVYDYVTEGGGANQWHE